MRKILILLCVLLASPAAAQIQKVQGVAGGYPVRVDVVSGGGGGGDATAANQTTEIARLTSILTALGGGLPASLVGGALSVTAAALPLPTGAATSALQTTGNTSLSSIDSTLTLVNAALAKLTIAQGAALGSNTVAMSGCSVATASPTYTSGTIQPCSLDTTGRLRALVTPNQQQTFVVSAQGIAPGNGKSMISIANGAGSGKTIRIQAIAIYPTTDSAVTGVNVQYDAFKFTTHASGTSLTAIALDSQNSLSGSVTAQTNATITGAGTIPLDSWFQNGDEITSASLTPSAQASIDGQRRRVYGVNELQPIVVRAGEGFFIKCQTNTTVGTFTVFVWFTQE